MNTSVSLLDMAQDKPAFLRAHIRSLLSKGDTTSLAVFHQHAIWRDRSPQANLTQLQLAPGVVRKNVSAVMGFLLEQGLDPYQLDPKGQCILQYIFMGIKERRADWLDALTQAGVPLNLTNSDGRTGLSMAARAKQPELVQRFIDAGIQLSQADQEALLKVDCQHSLNLLWNTFGKDRDQKRLDHELLEACRCGLQGQALALLDIGALPCLNDERKNLLTLLGNRAGLKSTLVQRLVQMGVDPNMPALDGSNTKASFSQQIHFWQESRGNKTSKHWRYLETVVREARQHRLEQIMEVPSEPLRRPRM